MKVCRYILVFAGCGLLLGGLAIQILLRPEGAGANGAVRLDTIVPRELLVWHVHDIPLDATETRSKNVVSALNCESYLYREYTRGGQGFAIYVMYWKAGQATAQSVASHSPEQCWVLNGWSCLQWKDSVLIGADGNYTMKGSWRRFSSPAGQECHVLYWHIVEGKIRNYGYRGNVARYAWSWVRDGGAQIVKGLPEQYFIRVSSRMPLDSLAEESGFAEVMKGFEALAGP